MITVAWLGICLTVGAIASLVSCSWMAIRKPLGDSALANECEAQRKRADLAEAAALASANVEKMAQIQDRREMESRANGAFDSAVCFQQYAAWIREGTMITRIHGSPAKTLSVQWSNDLAHMRGDALDDPSVFQAIINTLATEAQISSAATLASRPAVEWIAVSERMPEPQAAVLFVEDGTRQFGCWGGGSVWWRVDGEESYPEHEVTHWAPVPAPPTESRKPCSE